MLVITLFGETFANFRERLFQIKFEISFEKDSLVCPRKQYMVDVINIFIREIFCIPQFAKVYLKHFASFSPRESFSE